MEMGFNPILTPTSREERMNLKVIAFALIGTFWGLPALGQNEVCIPLYVDGVTGPYRWETTLVISNQQQTGAEFRLHFYDSNGQTIPGPILSERRGRGPMSPMGPGGQFDPSPINARTMRSYRSHGEDALQSGYCVVESQDRIEAYAQVRLLDHTGNVLSETGIIPGPQFRSGSFFADRMDGQGVGVAFANTSADETTCTLELFAEDGTTSLGTAEIQLGPGSHTMRMLSELFPDLLADEVGFIVVSLGPLGSS